MENLPSSFFIHNRSKLYRLLLPSSVVIISSNRTMPRSGDQHFPFRQSSDLFYLTGITNESVTLVIYPGPSSGSFREILYIPRHIAKQEKWNGPTINISEASELSGIKEIRYLDDMIIELREILPACSYIYFGMSASGTYPHIRSNEYEVRQSLSDHLNMIQEHQLAPVMTRLRMVKESEEVGMIKTAINITAEVFLETLQRIRPNIMEYELESVLTSGILKRGAKGHAFDPIIASGRNALVLHYIKNRGMLKNGELVLMDFGAEWQYYAADISRTVPVNGKFSKRQRQLYEATLRIMEQAMRLLKPGKKLSEYNQQTGALWEEEHIKLGLYSAKEVRDNQSDTPFWKRYFWHGTSHSLGIDVHDPVDQSMPIQEGMVLSCEPGIYIPEEGIGIRLENDMLITKDASVNLSDEIPINPDEIESMMNHQ